MPIRNEIGNRYGRLVVIAREPNNKYGNARWLCQCDCGNTTVVEGASLRTGNTASCGCLKKDMVARKNVQRTKHGAKSGYCETVEYRAYVAAKGRCTNPNNRSYKDYGGRGIEFRFDIQDTDSFIADLDKEIVEVKSGLYENMIFGTICEPEILEETEEEVEEENETLDSALNTLYQDTLESGEVQEFAENHPGTEMQIDTVVRVSVKGSPNCVIERTFEGYILKSEDKPNAVELVQ